MSYALRAGLRRTLEDIRKANGSDAAGIAAQAERDERLRKVLYELDRRLVAPDEPALTYEEHRAEQIANEHRWDRLTPTERDERQRFIIAVIDYRLARPFRIESNGLLTWLPDDRPRPVPPPGMEHLLEGA